MKKCLCMSLKKVLQLRNTELAPSNQKCRNTIAKLDCATLHHTPGISTTLRNITPPSRHFDYIVQYHTTLQAFCLHHQSALRNKTRIPAISTALQNIASYKILKHHRSSKFPWANMLRIVIRDNAVCSVLFWGWIKEVWPPMHILENYWTNLYEIWNIDSRHKGGLMRYVKYYFEVGVKRVGPAHAHSRKLLNRSSWNLEHRF